MINESDDSVNCPSIDAYPHPDIDPDDPHQDDDPDHYPGSVPGSVSDPYPHPKDDPDPYPDIDPDPCPHTDPDDNPDLDDDPKTYIHPNILSRNPVPGIDHRDKDHHDDQFQEQGSWIRYQDVREFWGHHQDR
ncbi:unnamed protein product, partial [Nesidiocoris tenuis]